MEHARSSKLELKTAVFELDIRVFWSSGEIDYFTNFTKLWLWIEGFEDVVRVVGGNNPSMVTVPYYDFIIVKMSAPTN